jgi:hypothetical protein
MKRNNSPVNTKENKCLTSNFQLLKKKREREIPSNEDSSLNQLSAIKKQNINSKTKILCIDSLSPVEIKKEEVEELIISDQSISNYELFNNDTIYNSDSSCEYNLHKSEPEISVNSKKFIKEERFYLDENLNLYWADTMKLVTPDNMLEAGVQQLLPFFNLHKKEPASKFTSVLCSNSSPYNNINKVEINQEEYDPVQSDPGRTITVLFDDSACNSASLGSKSLNDISMYSFNNITSSETGEISEKDIIKREC